MDVKSFYDAFTAEWEATESSVEFHNGLPFKNKPSWTSYMLAPNGFLNRVMRRLEDPNFPLCFKNEWYTVDALYIGGCDLYRKDLSYPSEVKAIIEHEWGDNLEEEMWKLIHWRSPLKVIIAYDWSEKEKTTEARRSWADNKIHTLLKMLQSANDFFSENTATQYLFLFAQHLEPNAPIRWRAATNTSFNVLVERLPTPQTVLALRPLTIEATSSNQISG
jgi:hypothetical protein